MRWGILGDIHANLEALDTVLAALEKERVDALYHVGDVVGYCTDFGPVIERLRREGVVGVAGNHELMVLGEMDIEAGSATAAAAARFTRAAIAPADRDYLAALPRRLDAGDAVFFHAFPEAVTGYISGPDLAAMALEQLDGVRAGWSVAFHGHTHKQRIFEQADGRVDLVRFGAGRVHLRPGARYLVCPGSVGVSRDRDPRAGYLLYQEGEWLEQRRVPYDWRACQAKLERAGLETRLFARAPRLGERVRQLAARALGRP